MKVQRQAAILRIVRERRIHNQEDLRQALAGEGYGVTQATLSRDVRELGLVKGGADGAVLHRAPQRGAEGREEAERDEECERANKGWRFFLWINYFAGFVVTILLILRWVFDPV